MMRIWWENERPIQTGQSWVWFATIFRVGLWFTPTSITVYFKTVNFLHKHDLIIIICLIFAREIHYNPTDRWRVWETQWLKALAKVIKLKNVRASIRTSEVVWFLPHWQRWFRYGMIKVMNMDKSSKCLDLISLFWIHHFPPEGCWSQETTLSVRNRGRNHLNHNWNIQPNQSNLQELTSSHSFESSCK